MAVLYSCIDCSQVATICLDSTTHNTWNIPSFRCLTELLVDVYHFVTAHYIHTYWLIITHRIWAQCCRITDVREQPNTSPTKHLLPLPCCREFRVLAHVDIQTDVCVHKSTSGQSPINMANDYTTLVYHTVPNIAIYKAPISNLCHTHTL